MTARRRLTLKEHAERLKRLEAVNTLSLSTAEANRIYCLRTYSRRALEKGAK